jgi:hypothetical protein
LARPGACFIVAYSALGPLEDCERIAGIAQWHYGSGDRDVFGFAFRWRTARWIRFRRVFVTASLVRMRHVARWTMLWDRTIELDFCDGFLVMSSARGSLEYRTMRAPRDV